MQPETPLPSRASLRALDVLNLVLADVRDGLGLSLAIYLATKHWDPSRIGVAMSAMGFAAVIAPTLAGALIDRTRPKRSWMVVAASMVAIGAVAMVAFPTFPVILGFWTLSAIAGIALAFLAMAMPETRPEPDREADEPTSTQLIHAGIG